ncbi:acyl-CoA N-acyltransferase [Dactylonectria macrodidyma]|uniref:Acyl-CoA N-acyltransferase n=1 Tax=Dactylonectria macrodidyma TaxID=307937 RepID=A0A9P9F514_9HYPO|nr:acyl-CoA N-acyltransferase [Dactylonectria macrodidyma]
MEAYIRPLSVRDLEKCVAVETAAFPPEEAASREKIEYRLSTFSDICFGLFLRGSPSSPVRLPDSIPYLSEAPVPEDGELVAHTLATRSTVQVVRDVDMELPSEWKTNPQAGPKLGQVLDGRTVAQHALAVSPKYQRSGLGKAIMRSYITHVGETGTADRISILAHDTLVPYYESMGFRNLGKSESTYAGATWYDLAYEFSPSSTASA